MKAYRIIVGLAVVFALAASTALAAGPVKSGPQPGDILPGPFHPLVVTGECAGMKVTLYSVYGENPVAMIFARAVTPEVTKLLKQIDVATRKHSDYRMGSFAVFLGEDPEELAKQLKELAKKEGLKEIILSIGDPPGPRNYDISKEAEVTVVLYTKRTVKANFAFKKGELKGKDIKKIVADVKKILPSE